MTDNKNWVRFVWNNCCECEFSSLHHQFNTLQTVLYPISWKEFNGAQVDAHNNQKSPKFPSSAIFDHSISSFRIAFIIIISNFRLLLLLLSFVCLSNNFRSKCFIHITLAEMQKRPLNMSLCTVHSRVLTQAAQSIKARVIEWWRVYIEQHAQCTPWIVQYKMKYGVVVYNLVNAQIHNV